MIFNQTYAQNARMAINNTTNIIAPTTTKVAVRASRDEAITICVRLVVVTYIFTLGALMCSFFRVLKWAA